MMKLVRLAAIVAAGLLACAPAAAQRLSALPAAGNASGTDTVLAQQPSLCAAGTTCSGVLMTLDQIVGYANATGRFQPSDADLSAIAALATQGYGRSFLTMPDAPTARAYLGLGSNALDSTPRAPAARLINTTAPLTGGGDLSADRTLGISLVNGVTAGAMSAPDKVKLDSVNVGASVSSVSCSSSGGLTCAVGSGTTAAQITLTPAPNVAAIAGLTTAVDQCIYWTGSAAAALYSCPSFGRSLLGSASASAAQATLGLGSAALASTGASGHTIGFLDGANTYTGAMTFSQIISGSVNGNAATATKLAAARSLSVTGDTSWTLNFDGSGNATGTSTLAASGVTAGTYGSATAVPVPTIDAKGRVTNITTAPLGAAASQTYVEGTFTPALTFGGASTGMTYSSQAGRYTRIGRMVFVSIDLVLSAKGSSTGNAVVTGLPFAPNSAAPRSGAPFFARQVNTSAPQLLTYIYQGQQDIKLLYQSNGTTANLDDTSFTNATELYISIAYAI